MGVAPNVTRVMSPVWKLFHSSAKWQWWESNPQKSAYETGELPLLSTA